MSPRPLITGGPEALLGVHDLRHLVDDGNAGPSVAATMAVDDRHCDANGCAAGALGVLIDDVSGYALAEVDPDGRRTVSTLITLDLLTVPGSGDELTATSTVRQQERARAVADGTVTDQHGRLVATFTQHGHFIVDDVDLLGHRSELAVDTAAASLPDLLGVSWGDVPGRLDVHVDAGSANPRGQQHGGVTLALADLAGRSATSPDGPVVTGSVQVLYQRPVPGGAALHVDTRIEHLGRSLRSAAVTGTVGDKPVFTARVVTWPAGRADRVIDVRRR